MRLLTFLQRPLRNTYLRAVVYTITRKPRHPPRTRRKPPPALKPVQPNQSPASRLYPKAAAPSMCGLIKPVPFSPLLPGQSPLSSIITAPATCHISQPRIPKSNKIAYIPVVPGQSPLSSLLAPRDPNCYMLEVPEKVPPVAATGGFVSASLALVICLVVAVFPCALVSRPRRTDFQGVASARSFNLVSARDAHAHSDVADDTEASILASEDGNTSIGSMDSDVTLVEHESGDEAKGTSGTVDGLLSKIGASNIQDKIIAQDDALKKDDALILKDNVVIVTLEEMSVVEEKTSSHGELDAKANMSVQDNVRTIFFLHLD